MATASTNTKTHGQTDSGRVAIEIEAELERIHRDLAALAKSVGKYGRARAEDLQHRAHDVSDAMIEDYRLALRRLGQQVAGLEKDLEIKVREHPLQWFLGVLGLGLLIAIIVKRSD